ncbi:hypothetical protein D3C72_2244970 [compost metagenome]
MNTGGAEQPLATFIQRQAQLQRLFAALQASAGHHHLHHASGLGTLENRLVFVGKTWVGQIDADVDELHGATSGRGPASITKLGENR